MITSLWTVCFIAMSLFRSSYSADIVINTTTTNATDLLCTNASSTDRCIIHCAHYRGAYQQRIDCLYAGVCILHVIAEECAGGMATANVTINATNSLQFDIYVSAKRALAHAEIYLPSNVNSSAYIYAHNGTDMLHEANIHGHNTETIVLNCSYADVDRSNAVSIYASNAHHLEIIVGPQAIMADSVIYCPQNGSCSITVVDRNSRFTNAAIYSLKGVNMNNHSDINPKGLQLHCVNGGSGASSTCQGTVIQCDIQYTTYGIAQYWNSNWHYGECANATRVINANYDPDNWYYVFSEKKQSSVTLQCDTGGSKKGCIIQCIHRGTYRDFRCGEGICIVNLVNDCGKQSKLYSHDASNLTVNVLRPNIAKGTFFKGRIYINDPATTNNVIVNCYADCQEMEVVYSENNVQLSKGNTFSSIEYLEVNVYRSGTIQSSVIRCPKSSPIQPSSCVVNCNSVDSNCKKVRYYSFNGVPELTLSCNHSDADHCVSSGPYYGIHCGHNTSASVQYDSISQQWDYGECTQPTIQPTAAQHTSNTSDTADDIEMESTDFEYRFENISHQHFAMISASIGEIESIVEDLYDDKTYDTDIEIIVNENDELRYVNRTVLMVIRVSYEEMYESDVINYTLSSQYVSNFEAAARQKLNVTIITVVIIKYINITNTRAVPAPTAGNEFVVDYMQALLILIWSINGIAISLAIAAFFMSKICKFRTDSANPFILILFGLRFTDIITDLNVSYVLWTDYVQHKSEDTLLFVLCVLSVTFLFLPWFANIYAISIIRKRLANNRRASLWFSTYSNSTFFLVLVVLTGDAFFALQVISSYLFGIKRLDAGISEKLEMDQFRTIKVFGVICSECIPQLIIAAIYAFTIENNNDTVLNIAVLSMIISAISIFICIASWLLMQSSAKQQAYQMVKYRIEMELNTSVPSINKENAKRKIMKYVGYKEKFRNNLSLTIGTERDQMEIVYTSMTDNGAITEVVQFVHNMEIEMNNEIQNIEAFVSTKYEDNKAQTNAMLQQHYDLNYGVTHKIVFYNTDSAKQNQ